MNEMNEMNAMNEMNEMTVEPAVLSTLLPGPLPLARHHLGAPQQAGALTMVPVFGPEYPGIVPPRSGLKLSKVIGYGQVELHNGAPDGVAIVPLHVGYIQDAAQNHALCRSALLAAGEKQVFNDACCVQESQGGYLAEKDQWFFVLPVELRAGALKKRNVEGYSKLWDEIGELNRRYGLPRRGHLEQILSRKRAVLTQFQNRLEPLPGQVGALFMLGDRFAGLEIAPDPRYFAEVWMPLVCFAYGVSAWRREPPRPAAAEPYALEGGGTAGLRAALEHDRARRLRQIAGGLAPAAGPVRLQGEESLLGLRLFTVTGEHLAGQVVTDGDRLVYASLFAPN